jgi:hypothetical protein
MSSLRTESVKPTLFRLLIETAISGAEAPIPAGERDYVAAIRAEAESVRKLELYAQAMRAMHGRLGALAARAAGCCIGRSRADCPVE